MPSYRTLNEYNQAQLEESNRAVAAQQAAANQAAQQKAARQNTERAAADAQIEADAASEEAAANQASSNRTNALATMLAQQRRTPGGGIRMGGRGNRRFSANSVGGLNRANAQGMASKRKAAAQAALTSRYAAQDYAEQQQNQQNAFASSLAAAQANMARGGFTVYH